MVLQAAAKVHQGQPDMAIVLVPLAVVLGLGAPMIACCV
jgi:hypothetical protein